MSSELFWLTLTTGFSALLFLPYAIIRIYKGVVCVGVFPLLADPLPGDDPFDEAWAHRAYRSHMNAVENLVVFGPLAIIVAMTGTGNDVTATACATYFWARVAHAPFYILKTPYMRTIAYFVGWGACLVLVYQILVSI